MPAIVTPCCDRSQVFQTPCSLARPSKLEISAETHVHHKSARSWMIKTRPIDSDVVGTNPTRFDISLVSDGGTYEATWNWRFAIPVE